MDKPDTNMAAHVRSIKQWLEKAEQSYDSQSEIKGELNLMLAEAEMKNLRKNHSAGRHLLYHGVAPIAIIVIAVFGIVFHPSVPIAESHRGETRSGFVSTSVQDNESTPEKQESQPIVSKPDLPEQSQPVDTAVTDEQPIETEQSPNQTVQETAPVQQYTAAPSANVLSDRQMQATVQDARRSLRGRTIRDK